jgi:hypothetical protein
MSADTNDLNRFVAKVTNLEGFELEFAAGRHLLSLVPYAELTSMIKAVP